MARSRHRRSSQFKSWHRGLPTARWTWLLVRCSSWRGTVKGSCIIRSASHTRMAFKEHKQLLSSCFWICFSSSVPTTKAQTKFRKPQYLRTAIAAEPPSTGHAQSSKAHTVDYSSTFVSTRVRQRKQEDMKENVKRCPEPCSLLLLYVKANNSWFGCFSKYCWHSSLWRAAP